LIQIFRVGADLETGKTEDSNEYNNIDEKNVIVNGDAGKDKCTHNINIKYF